MQSDLVTENAISPDVVPDNIVSLVKPEVTI